MMTHSLKIEHGWFERLRSGEKTFEIRLHDRDFQTGDRLNFICNADRCATGWSWEITHVLDDSTFPGVESGYCVLSLGNRRGG